jgi:hypothetical protein
VSSEDIHKGARWSPALTRQLASVNFGILCMTPENLGERWIHFEAGALSKAQETGRVSGLMLDVAVSDISGPLQQFQHTGLRKDELLKLIKSINEAMTEPVGDDVLVPNFEAHWPFIEGVIQDARNALKSGSVPPPKRRDLHEVLEEILTSIRELQRQGVINSNALDVTTIMLDKLNSANLITPARAIAGGYGSGGYGIGPGYGSGALSSVDGHNSGGTGVTIGPIGPAWTGGAFQADLSRPSPGAQVKKEDGSG